jgi:hypothetical protein
VPIIDPPHRWDLVQPDQLGTLPHVGEEVAFPHPRELAEATGLVTLGRGREIRSLLVQTMTTEPAYAESWLRTLARQLGALAG